MAAPHKNGLVRGVTILLVSVVLFVTGLWYVLRIHGLGWGAEETAEQRISQVGCPVLFTDNTEFKGNNVCYQMGRYEELDPQLEVILSYAVRAGYVVEGYEKADFGGERVLKVKGPKAVTFDPRNDKQVAFPRSMIVTLL